MNKVKVLVTLVGLFYMGTGIADEDIAERIKKVGEVCIEGKECGAAQVVAAAAGGGAGQHDVSRPGLDDRRRCGRLLLSLSRFRDRAARAGEATAR